ncbi:hypothetical protein GCM10017673_34240 [Streptosporangium violaceochromogenes]|nr:hypothetical protein GCM10017673_34240 [Streptosporangium violaceochromogenes]
MTRGIRVVVAAVVCGIVAAGSAACGGGAVNTSGGNTGAEMARLWGLLRRETGRLPEGFSARTRDGWMPPFQARNRDCRLVLDMAGGHPPRREPGARVAVTYPGDGLGELAGVTLASYAGEDARRHFDEITRAMNACRVVRSPAAGKGTSFKVSGLELDAVGGDVRARRLRGRLNGYPYEMHVVFALTGQTLVSLVHAGVHRVDAERTVRFARFLIERAASPGPDRPREAEGNARGRAPAGPSRPPRSERA